MSSQHRLLPAPAAPSTGCDDLLAFRQTLRMGKQHSVFAHIRLAHAVDKNLRRVNRELQDYESNRDQLVDEFAERDHMDRKIHVVHPDGTRIVYDEDADEWVHAEDGDDHEAGARFAPASEVARIRDRMGGALTDPDAFEEKLQELKDEPVEVSIHQVEADLLWDHAEMPDGVHAQLDLAALDPMRTDG